MHILNGFPSVQLMACHQKVVTGNLWINIWVFGSWLQDCVHWFTFETYIQSLNSGFLFADFVIFAFMSSLRLLSCWHWLFLFFYWCLELTLCVLFLFSWRQYLRLDWCFMTRALVYLGSLSSSVLIFIVYKITSLHCKNSSLFLYVLRKYFIISRYKDILKL